jgi:hypothetical protein
MYALTAWLLLVCVAVNVCFWGGVAASTSLAPVLREPLSREAPLAYTYLLAGEAIAAPLGLDESFAAFAEGQVQDPAQVLEVSALSVDRLMRARSGWLKPLHSAPLLLAPLALILWWRRPRPIKTFGGRR